MSSLELQLGGTQDTGQFGQLTVTGLATLNGSLKLTPVNGYVPQSGDAFAILVYGARSGSFALPPTGFTLTYDDDNGTLTVTRQ